MLDDKYVTMEIEKVKHIALVAHDGKKRELVDWCEKTKRYWKGIFYAEQEQRRVLSLSEQGFR